jgi:L-2,4-diaminobutyrate decarboxylase
MISDKMGKMAAASERAAATQAFKQYFLNDSSRTAQQYRELVASVAWEISEQISRQEKPYSGQKPADLLEQARSIDFFPEAGASLTEVLTKTRELVLENNISVYHPLCLAHLHCPVFISSLAAEMIISAFNQSMDSFDQAPAATMIEQALGEALCNLYGFGPNADATFTGGGTMSNFMGLLLARDHFSQARCGWNIQQRGLPPEASRFRILCAEHAHFTVAQSASILGLGQQAVVKIATPEFTEEVSALETTIYELRNQGLIPIAYVTTAGTTDFGTISNLSELADCAYRHGIWLHVDAAYGGGLIFSETHKQRLAGIEKADSVTIDFHKLFYQPISCGVFLVKDKSMFDYIKLHAEYLNPESNEQFSIIDLVYKSIQTTRRFDALKPFLALQHAGTRKFGEMVDHTIALAKTISEIIEADPQFELAHRPTLNAIVFRYVPLLPIDQEAENGINNAIKSQLLLSGEAIIGQTTLQEKAFLKFTLLNPMTGPESIVGLLFKIKDLGTTLEVTYSKAAELIVDEA